MLYKSEGKVAHSNARRILKKNATIFMVVLYFTILAPLLLHISKYLIVPLWTSLTSAPPSRSPSNPAYFFQYFHQTFFEQFQLMKILKILPLYPLIYVSFQHFQVFSKWCVLVSPLSLYLPETYVESTIQKRIIWGCWKPASCRAFMQICEIFSQSVYSQSFFFPVALFWK